MSEILDLIARLRAAGMDSDNILIAVEAIERGRVDALESRRSRDRERQARKRERDREAQESAEKTTHSGNGSGPETSQVSRTSHVMSRDTSVTPPSPLSSPPNPSPTPPTNTPPIIPPTPAAAADARATERAEQVRWVDAIRKACGPGARTTVPGFHISIARLAERSRKAGWSLEDDVIPVIAAKTGAAPPGKFSAMDIFESDIATHHARRTAPIPTGETHERDHPRQAGTGSRNRDRHPHDDAFQRALADVIAGSEEAGHCRQDHDAGWPDDAVPTAQVVELRRTADGSYR